MHRRFHIGVPLLLRLVALLGLTLLGLVLLARSPLSSESPPPPEKKPVTVWAITTGKVYHCPGSRWYGKTNEGKYVSECQAIRDGFRPAFGRGCGSECNK